MRDPSFRQGSMPRLAAVAAVLALAACAGPQQAASGPGERPDVIGADDIVPSSRYPEIDEPLLEEGE